MCEHGTNAGGSSEISEAFSFEFFAIWRGSELEMTEKEIFELLKPKPLMDYVCSIDDIKVGVSVTRALKFRKGFPDDDINRYSGNFTSEDAINLLEKKLNAIKVATEHQHKLTVKGTLNSQLWERQILHVWVQNEETAKIVSIVAEQLLKDHNTINTLVIISKAEKSEFIFSNKIKLQGRHVHTISKARSIEREAHSSKKS